MTMTTRDIDENVRAELNRLRESIDNIDAAVVHMLAERFKCTQQVGHLKAQHHLPPADPDRESRQIERLRQLAESAKLDPAFAEKLLNFIIAEVIRHHETIAAGPKAGPEADRNTAPNTAPNTPPNTPPNTAPDTGPKASPDA
jgi:chorismate mutase